MRLTTAAAIGIATGLALTAATTWRPRAGQAPAKQTHSRHAPNATNTIPNPAPTPTDPWPTITVDGHTYQVSPYASPIPCWFVGGKWICANGTLSDLNN